MTVLRKFLLVVSVPLVALIVAGALSPRAETRTDATLRDLKVFSETLALVERQYVEQVDFRQLERGAYQGLAESLDPWSSYHDPAQVKDLMARDRSGDIGILLFKHAQQYVRIVSVLPGSPADEADIARGEFIETIDGLETKDLTLEEAQLMLAGPPGSSVKLGFFREADDEEGRALDVARADLSALRVVVERRAEGAAALRVTDTRAGITRLVAAEIEALRAAGVSSLALDLRVNSGGDPQEAAELASMFAGPGPLAQRRTRAGSAPIAGTRAKAWDGQLVVLTSRATLGEAELVVDALRTRMKAPVIGQPTFGKRTQQDMVVLPDGTGLWMSVAEYQRADGAALPEKGIEPDEKVAARRAEPVMVEEQVDEDAAPDEAEVPQAAEEEAEPPAGKEGPGASPALPGVAVPVAPSGGKPAASEGPADPQLDRAFEILAGSPVKKAA